MLVHSSVRGRGTGERRLRAAEEAALAHGSTLLVLDTEAGSAGDRLYRRCGWTPLGTMPGFSQNTRGEPEPATFFYKRLAGAPDHLTPGLAHDLPAILAIYNHAVLDSTAVWTWARSTSPIARRGSRRAGPRTIPSSSPMRAEGALGYASYGDWRPFDGYLHTVEHSVYVTQDPAAGARPRRSCTRWRQKRRARTSMSCSAASRRKRGFLALHRSLGFVETASMPEVGRKFERWLDLVFMQKPL